MKLVSPTFVSRCPSYGLKFSLHTQHEGSVMGNTCLYQSAKCCLEASTGFATMTVYLMSSLSVYFSISWQDLSSSVTTITASSTAKGFLPEDFYHYHSILGISMCYPILLIVSPLTVRKETALSHCLTVTCLMVYTRKTTCLSHGVFVRFFR